MAITVDWGQKIINVPKTDLTLVQSSPVEVRQLDLNNFRLTLKDLEDDEEGISFPHTHNHIAPIPIAGIELARVIEIINDYTLTFEDGQYVVNVIGGNSNVLDRINPNQVSIRTANSAGLVQTQEIQYSSYQGGVSMNPQTGSSGTLFPIGTPRDPVNNLDDAFLIQNVNGLPKILYLEGTLAIPSDKSIAGFEIIGEGNTINITLSTINMLAGCTTTNVHIHDCTVSGVQGGEMEYVDCVINNLSNATCDFENCAFLTPTGAYTIQQSAAVATTHTTNIFNCYSDLGEVIFDRNSTKITSIFRNFNGRIKFINQNGSPSGNIWIHMTGGRVTIDSSCTTGKFHLSGNAEVVNNSGGSEVHTEGLTPSGIIRNHNLNNFSFVMYDTNGSPKTGLSITGYVKLDGAAFVPITNSPSEVSNGVYEVDLAAADLDGRICMFRMTAAGAVDTFFSLVTEP